MAPGGPHQLRCRCGRNLTRFWWFCPWCARSLTWADDPPKTGAECYRCGWVVSDVHSFCAWCGAEIYEEDVSAEDPLKAPKGFRFDAYCDAGAYRDAESYVNAHPYSDFAPTGHTARSGWHAHAASDDGPLAGHRRPAARDRSLGKAPDQKVCVLLLSAAK